MILRIAVPVPLRRTFDYLPLSGGLPAIGARVVVRFGRRRLIGAVVEHAATSDIDTAALKTIESVLDDVPLVSPSLVALVRWLADYYAAAIGEAAALLFPAALRRGEMPPSAMIVHWRLTDLGHAASAPRGAVQQRLWAALRGGECTATTLGAIHAAWQPRLRAWERLGLVARRETLIAPLAAPSESKPAPSLNAAQQAAATSIEGGTFSVSLLHGITGSGKTEVYLAAIAQQLAQGRQVLVLVPEIALTPQLLARFRERIALPVAVLHSGRSDVERAADWLAAAHGQARVVIGTRSALFTPLPQLGLIIIDEEHDASLKQQDGVRYHARDVAIMRARLERIPVVLGSATPSLETFRNAEQGRYRLIELPQRAGDAALPAVHLLNLRQLAVDQGLTHPLMQALAVRLERGEQSLLFLNRRGFAPVLWCRQCAWSATCQRCDARLAVHAQRQRLLCHHCGNTQPLPSVCPSCGTAALTRVGAGTERVETVLAKRFPQARLLRIDSDATARRGELERRLDLARTGAADILIGTQMLSKGHDFPALTLVGVLDADQGLLSVDFRGSEQLFQQIMQVAGRAGRAARAGEVLIQTRYPEHPLFQALRTHDYRAFATRLLQEREQAGFPPSRHFILLRAEAHQPQAALNFLRSARDAAKRLIPAGLALMDPLPSPMERRAGRYRAQLLVEARERKVLHGFMHPWIARLEALPSARRVRWHIDVDPVSMY